MTQTKEDPATLADRVPCARKIKIRRFSFLSDDTVLTDNLFQKTKREEVGLFPSNRRYVRNVRGANESSTKVQLEYTRRQLATKNRNSS